MNKQLIPVSPHAVGQQTIQTVSARELHTFLGNKDMFANWIKDRIEQFGFVENQDFVTYLENTKKGRPSKEYALTLNMGKELSMVERNQKGKEARQYFIACEDQAKNLTTIIRDPKTQALVHALTKIDELEYNQNILSDRTQQIEYKLDSMTPSLPASTIFFIQGQISHVAAIYRKSQEIKLIRMTATAAKQTVLANLLAHFKLNDIAYAKDVNSIVRYLKQVASGFEAEYDKWFERNSLFAGGAK